MEYSAQVCNFCLLESDTTERIQKFSKVNVKQTQTKWRDSEIKKNDLFCAEQADAIDFALQHRIHFGL